MPWQPSALPQEAPVTPPPYNSRYATSSNSDRRRTDSYIQKFHKRWFRQPTNLPWCNSGRWTFQVFDWLSLVPSRRHFLPCRFHGSSTEGTVREHDQLDNSRNRLWLEWGHQVPTDLGVGCRIWGHDEQFRGPLDAICPQEVELTRGGRFELMVWWFLDNFVNCSGTYNAIEHLQ